MPDLTALGLPAALALFLAASLLVLGAGVHLTRLADRLADMTGWGEAIVGGVILGAVTSLSGGVTSVSAAAGGHAELAVSNAVGGIAAQTVFLVVADWSYRRVNLEHAAASLPNMINGVTLIAMLAIPLLARQVAPATFWGIHPASFMLFAVYAGSIALARRSREQPMWRPLRTRETREDVPDDEDSGRSPWRVAAMVAVLGLLVGGAGYVIAQTGLVIASRTDLSEGIVGTLLTSVATSTPELVTTVAAVRRGALTLAFGGIVGGNTFDVLFTAFADLAYPGSIYHAMTGEQVFVILLTIVMTTVLLLGLIQRERHGLANIGFESVLLLLLYCGGMTLLLGGAVTGG
ncbi:sodium:calcium antiporter [Marinibaculum pumilum]|uniref:Sodium:calcium antiporter n=1 Tax=Marinibaculum pumilum TaxID=1766165 RepID=A0ABV7L8Y6_9PROT